MKQQLNETELKTLLAVSTYVYMTVQQMEDSGIASADWIRRSILECLARRKRPLLQSKSYGATLSTVYALNKAGAKYIADHFKTALENIYYPIKISFSSGQYFHRLACVDTHISFRKWMASQNGEVNLYHNDFVALSGQRSDQGLKWQTQIYFSAKGYIRPDGISQFSINEKRRLCAIEIHRGHDSKRVFEQLKNYLYCLTHGILENKYKHPNACFVLSIHDNSSTFNGARKRLLELPEFEGFKPLFLFNRIDQIKESFSKGWITADGLPSPVFLD